MNDDVADVDQNPITGGLAFNLWGAVASVLQVPKQPVCDRVYMTV